MSIRVTFRKFRFDKDMFINIIAERILVKLFESGRKAFRLNWRRVPVWTGESLGGLRAIPEALGDQQAATEVMNYARVFARQRNRRQYKGGPYKNADSARSVATTLKRTTGNRIVFSYTNAASGFRWGDKREIRNSPTSPWGFSRNFVAAWKTLLAAEMRTDRNIKLMSFSAAQKESGR